MSENMQLWRSVEEVPSAHLQKIAGGRLKGFTSVRAQWRLLALTDQFGPCGFGWKYTIDKQWIEEGDGSQRCAFVNVSLYVKIKGEWSDSIPGTGGSMLVAQESKGAHTNDDAYKMALTDALGVAAKALGFAAKIYMDQWDGDKYAPSQMVRSETLVMENFQSDIRAATTAAEMNAIAAEIRSEDISVDGKATLSTEWKTRRDALGLVKDENGNWIDP